MKGFLNSLGSIALLLIVTGTLLFFFNYRSSSKTSPLAVSASAPVTVIESPLATLAPTHVAPAQAAAAISPIATPEAAPNMVVAPEAIPACVFNTSAMSAQPALSLDAYVFSEPRVVLTSKTGLRLYQWLPDSQRLLIGRSLVGRPGATIETFDLKTGQLERYAEWQDGGGKPLWLPTEQSVAFVDLVPPSYARVLRLSRGAGSPVEELADGLANPLLALEPDSQSVIFSADAQNGRPQSLQMINPAKSSKPSPLSTGLPEQSGTGWNYSDSWSTDGKKDIRYGQGNFYLIDRLKGTVCAIHLGNVGGRNLLGLDAVKWSSDGRYIAAAAITGEEESSLGSRLGKLLVIDTLTGERREFDFGFRHVHSIDWFPNTHYALITVGDELAPLSGFKNLYLVEAATGNFKNTLPRHRFFTDEALWSPDGKTIVVSCGLATDLGDNKDEYRVCAIAVEEKQ